MNVCTPYPLLEVPVNIFRHALDITIGHVNNSTVFFYFPHHVLIWHVFCFFPGERDHHCVRNH